MGGTSGIGRAVAEALAKRGGTVYITGRDTARTEAIAAEIGPNVKGVAFDLSDPTSIGPALASLGPVDKVVVSAIERDSNNIREYDIKKALRLVTLKLVGQAGKSYSVQFQSALNNSAAWTTLRSITAATTGELTVTDADPSETRFYRLVSPAQP